MLSILGLVLSALLLLSIMIVVIVSRAVARRAAKSIDPFDVRHGD